MATGSTNNALDMRYLERVCNHVTAEGYTGSVVMHAVDKVLSLISEQAL